MAVTIRRNERGFGHLLVIVLVVVVVAGVGFIGWKVESNKKTTTKGTTTSNPAPTSTNGSVDSNCLSTYHDSNLCKFAANSIAFEKTAYMATVTSHQNGTSGTLTLENDGKGNTKLSGTEAGQVFNAITLNGVTYIQSSGSGPWIEYPSGSSAPTSTTSPTSNMNIAVGASGITYKALDTVTCGNLTCFKYQVTDNSMPGAKQYAWFDNSSYKLREWQYTDGGNSTDMVVTYGSVNITKPSPVESISSLTQ